MSFVEEVANQCDVGNMAHSKPEIFRGESSMRHRAEGHQNGVTRSLRWAMRGALSLAGAALLGGALTAAASADDSLVGGLLEDAGEVVEDTTGIVGSVTDVSESEGLTVDVGESTENEPTDESASIVAEVVQPVVETTEAVTEAAEPVVETTEAVTEAAEPVVETTEAVTEAAEPVVETTEAVTEAAEPVVETTEAVTEAAEPVVETTEAVTEATEPQADIDTSAASQAPAPSATEGDEQAEPVVSESTVAVEDSGSLLREVTGLLAPVTSPIDDVVEPVTGERITSTVGRVADRVRVPVVDELAAPVVDDVVAPVLAPVVDDVVVPVVDGVAAPVLAPVLDQAAPVLAPVLQDVVTPVVGSVATEVATPIVTFVAGEPFAAVVIGAPMDVDDYSSAHLVSVSPSIPLDVDPPAAEWVDVETPVSEAGDVNAGRVSAPSAELAFVAQPFAEVDANATSAPNGTAVAAAASNPGAGEAGGQNAPTPAGAPTSAPTTASSAGQAFGAGYADAVGGLLLPANALSTDLAASTLPTVAEVILKVAVAPD
ncbi:hypothetical protein [Ruania zhangjianzhongii]|uniref:hypothetical protein n=1 Tax=Ruania zhangjianzhongii TaxID=2603206 RepID=UPI0011CB8860|nr:hypothetical protein [Ruania zhangjianzhongii]